MIDQAISRQLIATMLAEYAWVDVSDATILRALEAQTHLSHEDALAIQSIFVRYQENRSLKMYHG